MPRSPSWMPCAELRPEFTMLLTMNLCKNGNWQRLSPRPSAAGGCSGHRRFCCGSLEARTSCLWPEASAFRIASLKPRRDGVRRSRAPAKDSTFCRYSPDCRRELSGGAGFNNSFGDGVARESRDVVDVQLGHDVFAMVLDGLDTDAQFAGDLLIGFAFGDQLQHFRLAGGQTAAPLLHEYAANHSFAIVPHELLRNGGTEECLAGLDFAYRRDEVDDSRLFEQIACRTGLTELVHVFVVAVRGEDEHSGARERLEYLSRGFQAVEHWHGDIHHYHVGLERPGQFHGLPARLGFTNGFDIRFRLQQRAESLPHNGVIVS